MIDFIQQLWNMITLPLSWMPDYCSRVLAGVATLVVLVVVLPLFVKLVQLGVKTVKTIFS